jgi:uncharacterized membrane protein YphA (DoxX/SURF4 family)
MNLILKFSRYFVGSLFIFSGLIKLNDPVGTAIKLEEYFVVFANDFGSFFQIFIPAALVLALVLNVLEILLGIAVLRRYRFRLTAWFLLGLIVFFTFLTFYSAYFNKVTDCGCFGDAIKLTPWESFAKDIILLVFILILFFNRNLLTRQHTPRIKDITMGAYALIFGLMGVYAILHLPFIDFRAYKVGTHIPTAMKPSGELKYRYVMEKDGKKYEFDEYPTEGGYEFVKMELLNPEVQPKITDYSVWNEEGDFTEMTFQGNKLLIIIHSADNTYRGAFDDINHLVSTLNNSIKPLVLTASGDAEYDKFRHDVQLAVPYYFADMTVLKTIVRSNPGIVLMQDGTVMGKWHYNDVPNISDLNEILD